MDDIDECHSYFSKDEMNEFAESFNHLDGLLRAIADKEESENRRWAATEMANLCHTMSDRFKEGCACIFRDIENTNFNHLSQKVSRALGTMKERRAEARRSTFQVIDGGKDEKHITG